MYSKKFCFTLSAGGQTQPAILPPSLELSFRCYRAALHGGLDPVLRCFTPLWSFTRLCKRVTLAIRFTYAFRAVPLSAIYTFLLQEASYIYARRKPAPDLPLGRAFYDDGFPLSPSDRM